MTSLLSCSGSAGETAIGLSFAQWLGDEKLGAQITQPWAEWSTEVLCKLPPLSVCCLSHPVPAASLPIIAPPPPSVPVIASPPPQPDLSELHELPDDGPDHLHAVVDDDESDLEDAKPLQVITNMPPKPPAASKKGKRGSKDDGKDEKEDAKSVPLKVNRPAPRKKGKADGKAKAAEMDAEAEAKLKAKAEAAAAAELKVKSEAEAAAAAELKAKAEAAAAAAELKAKAEVAELKAKAEAEAAEAEATKSKKRRRAPKKSNETEAGDPSEKLTKRRRSDDLALEEAAAAQVTGHRDRSKTARAQGKS
jgi:hypothetical protein